jgi:hypothetical protein
LRLGSYKCRRQQQIPFGDDNKKGKNNRRKLVAGVGDWEMG